MDAKAAVELINQHGVYGLSSSDGCRCAHFMVMGVHVDISCHKSNGAVSWHQWGVIRVYSNYMDVQPSDLRLVADAVETSLHDPRWNEEYQERYWFTRFCDWQQDDKQTCIYCSKPRENEQGYLCETCLAKPKDGVWGKVSDQYDYRQIEREWKDIPTEQRIQNEMYARQKLGVVD